MATFGKAPQQLQLELIAELLEERAETPDFHEWTLGEAEEVVRGYQPYDWEEGAEGIRNGEIQGSAHGRIK